MHTFLRMKVRGAVAFPWPFSAVEKGMFFFSNHTIGPIHTAYIDEDWYFFLGT